MTEKEFLIKLEQLLSNLKKEERLDIIRDFKEYFSSGRSEGKTDGEIIESFGPMEGLAEELLSAYSDDEFITNVDMVGATEKTFNKVDIISDKANILIVPSNDDQPYIHVKDNDGRTKVTMDVSNNTLNIRVGREKSINKFFFGFIKIKLISNNSQVTVQLPQKLYEELIVKNNDGRIEAESIQAKKMYFETDNGRIIMQDLLASTLKTETDNGRIVLERSNFTTVYATTDNGRIIINKSKAEKLELQTDNGAIELNDVMGEIVATTDNGRIEGYIPVVTKPLKWKTDNGSILLKTDEPLEDAILSTKSDIGGIDVYGEKGSKFLFGQGTVPIQFKTDIGRITVKTATLEEV